MKINRLCTRILHPASDPEKRVARLTLPRGI